ncbi:MAG TPA: type II secretion system F family protein [Phycisphaerae bacterium]|nr:type II secretion system F family protein [Phycisphaerae bacterium]
MGKFTVQFADSAGRIDARTIEASSERAAVAQVETDGYTPISVRAAGLVSGKKTGEAKAPRLGRPRLGRAMHRAVLDFTHQFTAVAESGIPTIAGLKAIAEQTENSHLRAAIGRIISRIEDGRSLADAMAGEPAIFPSIYVKTVAAGEAAGKVAEVLAALARYQEQDADTRSQVKSAMLYPALVAVSLIAATVFMLVFVVPQFAKLFEKFKGELPAPTRVLLAVSGVFVNHYVLLILGIIAVAFGVRAALRLPNVRTWCDERLLRMPVFGNLLLGAYMVRFIELLDLLMQAALPITQALHVTADSTTNASLRRDVLTMLHSAEGGHSLTDAFAETRWLTPLVKRMLAVGEQAGRTDQIFAYLRKYYAAQTQRGVKLLSTLIEPVMVTCLASVVLFFALAIFLPMWRLLKIMGKA